jgi:hypothetical protein
MTTTFDNYKYSIGQNQTYLALPLRAVFNLFKKDSDTTPLRSASLENDVKFMMTSTSSILCSNNVIKRYADKDELFSIFGTMISFPDSDEKIYNKIFESKCTKTGVNIFDL